MEITRQYLGVVCTHVLFGGLLGPENGLKSLTTNQLLQNERKRTHINISIFLGLLLHQGEQEEFQQLCTHELLSSSPSVPGSLPPYSQGQKSQTGSWNISIHNYRMGNNLRLKSRKT